MPEGMMEVLGANKGQVTALRERLDKVIREQDPNTGFWRRIGFKVPISTLPTKFVPFQLDPKVMQIIEQQTWFTKIVWACFGVTADQMGFTEDSNKATGANQTGVYQRKAVKPMLALIKYHMDKEIIPEWGEEAFKSLEFKWEDYNLDEDIKKHTLYEAQIRMGIKTAEMIAEEEGIDLVELKRQKDEAEAKEQEQWDNQNKEKEPFGDVDKKAIDIVKGTTVKIIGNHKVFAGQVGTVDFVRTNGEEKYYMVRFRNGMDIFFTDEVKVVGEQITMVADGTLEPELAPDNVTKSVKYESALEEELITAIKSRSKDIMKALDQMKNGQLDKIN